MTTFDSLLTNKAKATFNADIKQYLLAEFRLVIYKNLQPQMGGFIDQQSIGLSILNSRVDDAHVIVKCAIFYIEQIGGCNCNDGPHEENGYIEQEMKLSKGQLVFSG